MHASRHGQRPGGAAGEGEISRHGQRPGGAAGDEEVRAQRASSFGSHAAAYAEHRPGYAEDAVRWALAPVAGRRPLRVLDLGAGTGKLAETLTALADPPAVSVTAVEPDAAMLAELRRRLPAVTAVRGTAEQIPLPAASVDAALCGQAAHWFDMDRATPEVARVLTHGGVFAALWNMDDDTVPWVAELVRLYGSGLTLAQWKADTHVWPEGAGAGAFGPGEQALFPHGHRRTADSLVAMIETHSRQIVMDPAERGALLDRIRAYLASRPETADGEFCLPMMTGVLRSVKA